MSFPTSPTALRSRGIRYAINFCQVKPPSSSTAISRPEIFLAMNMPKKQGRRERELSPPLRSVLYSSHPCTEGRLPCSPGAQTAAQLSLTVLKIAHPSFQKLPCPSKSLKNIIRSLHGTPFLCWERFALRSALFNW